MREAEKGNSNPQGKQRSAVDTENQRRKLARKQEVAIRKARRLIFFVLFCINILIKHWIFIKICKFYF